MRGTNSHVDIAICGSMFGPKLENSIMEGEIVRCLGFDMGIKNRSVSDYSVGMGLSILGHIKGFDHTERCHITSKVPNRMTGWE